MNAIELLKTYNPKDFESRIYDFWMKHNLFSPEGAQLFRTKRGISRDPSAKDSPFVVVIPPPNVTGVLHLGHGLNNSLQDVLVRFHRMLGEETLWVPGTDHAGIATQNIVEKRLAKNNIKRKDLGRDKFIEETWKVKDEHHSIITSQLKQIMSSCDWSRERFTLDEGLSNAVKEVFVTLFERGLIYKGTYLVNWSTGMQSALSDDEVEMKEVHGKFYRLKYPLADGSGFVKIATTRPETLLGDAAVAVHPEDERYKGIIGKKLKLPLTDREIPVIADTYVDKEFGTGLVKITPAHDFNDYEVGKRHNLPELNIMNPDGTLNANAPSKYQGMKMAEARKVIVQDLDALGLFEGADEHIHQVGHCYRTDTIIEPYLSTQWFVRMQPLAEKALKAWENGEIVFHPRRWENTYNNWLKNIRDWCISRQLWWGHRIPAWYDKDTGEVIVSRTDPTTDPAHRGKNLVQDEDVLDTWFSSWLWPFSVMGWPEKTPDFNTYYPTSSLVTAYDIIFFWVSRMVMAGLEFTGKVPYKDIYITPLVRDKQGRKMSKSLGNGIDPLEIVDQFGADALKFTLSFLSAQGQDILMDKETFGIGSRFANKIWNASRYILSNIGERNFIDPQEIISSKKLKIVDSWILSRLSNASKNARDAMLAYRYNDASQTVYEFFWNDFCDWYIEATKLSLYSGNDAEKDRATSLLLFVLEESLKLLHPFLPAITEEIFQKLPQVKDRALIVEAYPQVLHANEAIEHGFNSLQELVRSVRTLRSEFTVPPSAKIRASISFDEGFNQSQFIIQEKDLVSSLIGAEEIEFLSVKGNLEKGSVAVAGKGFEVFVFVRDLIDLEALIARLNKNIEKDQKSLEQVRAKLSKEAFISNAAPEAIEKEKSKLAEFEQAIAKNLSYIAGLR